MALSKPQFYRRRDGETKEGKTTMTGKPIGRSASGKYQFNGMERCCDKPQRM